MCMRETVFSPSRKGQGFCGVPGIQEGQVSAGELDKVLKAALGERRVQLRQVS